MSNTTTVECRYKVMTGYEFCKNVNVNGKEDQPSNP